MCDIVQHDIDGPKNSIHGRAKWLPYLTAEELRQRLMLDGSFTLLGGCHVGFPLNHEFGQLQRHSLGIVQVPSQRRRGSFLAISEAMPVHFSMTRAHVAIADTSPEFPLGARGQRPIRFTLKHADDARALKAMGIPGVLVRGSQVHCAFDAASTVAQALGEPEAFAQVLQERCTMRVPLPGKAKYDASLISTSRRDYQAEGIRFLLRRSHAILGDVPRAGKCLMILGTAVLADVPKVLILCNSLGKYVWAEEIAKWLGESCTLLFGRSGTEARTFCVTCMGRGSVPDTSGDVDEYGTPKRMKCRACMRRGQSRGEVLHLVRTLEQETQPEVYFQSTGRLKKDGTPHRQRRVRRVPVPGVFQCPRHPDEVDTHARLCTQCQADLYAEIDRHRFVVVNYDILTAQRDRSDTGRTFVREDLAGWAPILARHQFAMAVADESHKLRGWHGKGAGSKTTQTRRERANEVCANIPRVYGVTGTPVYGFTRDLWGQLDFVSGGLWDRKPFVFHAAYCEGRKNDMGYWEADGRSIRAETELTKRLDLVMIKRPREVIWASTPPKTRQVVMLDVPAAEISTKALNKLTQETHLFKALERTLEMKVDAICEHVLEELLLGEKTIVWVLTRESVEIMAQALERASVKKDVSTRLRETRCRLWATHGEADIKVRFDIAAQFREHQGAGVLVATMDSLPESISLFGASTEHYAQLHYLSGPMEQSENRPYLKGTSKLHIYYYVARGTVDERMVNMVLPRLATADLIGQSKDAAATSQLFTQGKPAESFEDFVARLTAHATDEVELDFDALTDTE
jgi:hypothetical protein